MKTMCNTLLQGVYIQGVYTQGAYIQGAYILGVSCKKVYPTLKVNTQHFLSTKIIKYI